MVINDALVQEVQVFKEHTNVFDEYMFSSFFFKPTSEAMLYRILARVLTERYILDAGTTSADKILEEITSKYLNVVYDDFFNYIHS